MVRKKLAVVVPMYNIEDFLREALDSLLKQGVDQDDMQVILIDDGSQDSTFEIAETYAKRYPKMFEAHQFENAGLGAARNRGTRIANADYITYVDPDDIVVDNSYRKALSILDKTKSEVLIGGTKRFNSKRVWNSVIHAKAVTKDKLQTTLQESPELVWDSTSWNKIYKLSYMRENDFYFPEGMLYEDLPAVTPALAKAKSIDVMADTLYLWRVRDFGAPSITQLSSNDPTAILDRLKANSLVLESLNALNVEQRIIDIQAAKFLDFDTLMMFRKDRFNLFSAEQKEVLFNALKNYLQLFTAEQLANSKFENQAYLAKVLELDNQNEFDNLTLNFLRNDVEYSGQWVDNNWELSSNISDVKKFATSDDFTVNTRIEHVDFVNEELHVSGYAFAQYSDMSQSDFVQNAKIKLYDAKNALVNDNVGHVRFSENKNITAKFGYNQTHFVKDVADFNYDFSAYDISVPLSELVVNTDFLTLKLEFEVDGISVETAIMKPVTGPDARPITKVSPTLDSAFDIAYDTSDWKLNVKPTLDVATLEYHDGDFTIKNAYDNVILKQGGTKLQLEKFGNNVLFPSNVVKRLSKYEKESRGDWRFITNHGSKWKPVYLVGNTPVDMYHETFFKTLSCKNGQASLEVSWYYPKTTKVSVLNDVLTIDFELFGWEAEATQVQVIADAQLPNIVWNTEKVGVSTYRLTLPLTLDGFGEKEWLNFQVRMKFADGYEASQLLKWGDASFDLEGQVIPANNIGWEFRRIERNNSGFAIKRTADRTYWEQDGSRERFLETTYKEWRSEPLLENYIMLSSFWGRNNAFNDNPEAMYQYIREQHPEMTSIIMVRDAIRSYPEYPNAKVVSYDTAEYWYYLARAKYFVNNVNYVENGRVKRAEQLEVQTMHGTPLKKLGFDVLEDWNDRTYLSMQRKNQNWDYLLTPSDWVADYAKEVFASNPKVIKSGYPRNDRLFMEHSVEEKNALKEKLGLPLDKKIIALAPTWRNKTDTPIKNYLDVAAFYKAIPDDAVVVLKNHHYETWTGLDKKYKDRFAYANANMSIEDLYIVADALITDYSSVMFDFSLLKKPMMFYAFDYDEYLETRGVNFDFKNEAPGPFIENQTDLEYWINQTDNVKTEFEEKISEFEEKFIQYDLGNASEIAVETLLKGEK